jgi:rhamnosyltransferase
MPLNESEILAIVVSFNGQAKTLETVEQLRRFVGHVLVVDNGSDLTSVTLLGKYDGSAAVSVMFLPENRGIGYGLNMGVDKARQCGYRWLLTMDQDSYVDDGMIEKYKDYVLRHADSLCLTPTLILNGDTNVHSNEDVGYAITSGNLVRIDVFDRVGLYDEQLFIDGVDFDFSLRVRKAGLKICRVVDGMMRHELGQSHGRGGILKRFHTFHSPVRRYYMYRNLLVLVERYGRLFPSFICRLIASHLIYLVTILFFGKDRLQSYIYIGRGIADYFNGRDGALRR